MCCAALMEQGCCYFGNKNGRKALTHHLWNHVLRDPYGARLLLRWQQTRLQIFNSPSSESCVAQLLCSQENVGKVLHLWSSGLSPCCYPSLLLTIVANWRLSQRHLWIVVEARMKKQSNAHSHSSSHGTSSKPFCLILRPFSVVIAAIVLETSHAIVCEESVRPCETLGVSYSLEV